MDEAYAAGRRLVESVQPYLQNKDRDGLARYLSEAWSADCLCPLLESSDPSVVAAAIESLGLTGGMQHAPRIAAFLQIEDASLVQLAEDALWSIWFRDGGTLGCAVLTRISRSLRQNENENAIPLLTELIRAQPTFAEAFHQRSQAYFLIGDYTRSLNDARRACRLNPTHFAALATEGHCFLALGRLTDALEVYRAVLRIHPHMSGIREQIHALRSKLVLSEA